MICKYSIKKHFICLVFSFVFISEWTEARSQAVETGFQEWDHQERSNPLKGASFGITLKIPFDIFRDIKTLPPSVTITVKDYDIELASVMEGMELVTKSLHDYLPQVDAVFSHIRSKRNNLCTDSYFAHLSICSNKKAIQKFDTSLNVFRNSVEAQVSDRILYPQGYAFDKSDSEVFFKKAIALLNTGCTQTCSNTDIAKAIRLTLQEEYRQLYDKIKTKNQSCQKIILEQFAKSLTAEDFPLACQEEKNKHHTVCKTMLKDIAVIDNRFKELLELVYGSEILQTTEAQAYCLDCALKSNNTRSLSNFLDILDEQNRCLNLNPKEEKTIYSSTGLKPYTVKKETDGSYSISLTMRFSADQDYDGSIPSDQVPDHYMQKAQECIQQSHQKMVGPKDEKLQVTINSPKHDSSICEKNKINHILISSSAQRDNSKIYSSDIDCSTITYQVLHLLGLRDEHQKNKEEASMCNQKQEI